MYSWESPQLRSPRIHSTREATIPLPLATIVATEIARMFLVVAAPVGTVIVEQHGIVVDTSRGDDQDGGKLAVDADALARRGIRKIDATDFCARCVFDVDVEFVVAAWVVGFVLLVLGYVHAAPAGSISLLHKRGA